MSQRDDPELEAVLLLVPEPARRVILARLAAVPKPSRLDQSDTALRELRRRRLISDGKL